MNRREYMILLGEKTSLERMLADTPEEDVLDRLSLTDRLQVITEIIAAAELDEREPARVCVTFRGAPVVGSHGIFAEFGMKAVTSFTETVVAMAASLAGPLAPMGPIRDREQHQLLITSTAVGSFGFELEEHRVGQLKLEEPSPVAQALERTQRLLRATLGDDEELADSVADTDRRALDKARAFLQTLVDHDAVCSVQVAAFSVSFNQVSQVARSLARLSNENVRESAEELVGEFQGVLPKARTFEFKLQSGATIIRGKVGPAADPDEINRHLHQPSRIALTSTQVGAGRPRYVLVAPPTWIGASRDEANE